MVMEYICITKLTRSTSLLLLEILFVSFKQPLLYFRVFRQHPGDKSGTAGYRCVCVPKCICQCIMCIHTQIYAYIHLNTYIHIQTVFLHRWLWLAVHESMARTHTRESWHAARCLPSMLPEGFWLKSSQPSWGKTACHSEAPRVDSGQVVQEP